MMKFLQRLGKSLMLPVAVLPICGILMGLGYLMCPNAMQGGDIAGILQSIGFILVKAGGALIDNMAWLFVIGVAVGMADDGHGASALAGIVSWFIITGLLSPTVLEAIMTPDSTTLMALEKIQNPFVGILAGLIGSTCYNKFKNIKLPDFLAFFSGRRFVAIATALISVLVAVIMFFLWPLLFTGLTYLGNGILKLGGIGAGIYAFLNRLLIPFGLHHALNNIFWFDTVGIGDLVKFWAGKTSADADVSWSLGMYMSGFFPCMMFGIPGAALAMIKNAKNKKKAMGMLISVAICAFFCGVTEPFEFAFMFAAFPLYVVYSLLYGIFTVITYFVGFRAGFSFSAGAVDLFFSSSLPAAAKTWLIIPLGIAAFVVFFLVFNFAIKWFKFKTPGREDEDEDSVSAEIHNITDADRARRIILAIGGKANITNVDCCATRLRISLIDSSKIDKKACKALGVLGVVVPDKTSCQLIIGVTVQQVLEDVKGVLANWDESLAESAAPPVGKAVTHNDIIATVTSLPPEDPIIPQTDCDDFENIGTEITYKITDPLGIHARPAAGLCKIAKEIGCKVTITKGLQSVDGGSVVSIMSLGVKQGDEITVNAEGDGAEKAIARINKYLGETL